MKDYGLAISGPVCLVIALCGLAMLAGYNPWSILQGVAIVLPIVAYLVFSIFTVVFAINTGEIGVRQNMTFQGKLYFWHGIAVVLTIVLAAAGSFIVLFMRLSGGLTSGLHG